MLDENETLPADERLELKEFNLDLNDQKHQAAVVEEEVARVKTHTWLTLIQVIFNFSAW